MNWIARHCRVWLMLADGSGHLCSVDNAIDLLLRLLANVIVCSYFGGDVINIIGRGSSLVTPESSGLLSPWRSQRSRCPARGEKTNNQRPVLALLGPNIPTEIVDPEVPGRVHPRTVTCVCVFLCCRVISSFRMCLKNPHLGLMKCSPDLCPKSRFHTVPYVSFPRPVISDWWLLFYSTDNNYLSPPRGGGSGILHRKHDRRDSRPLACVFRTSYVLRTGA